MQKKNKNYKHLNQLLLDYFEISEENQYPLDFGVAEPIPANFNDIAGELKYNWEKYTNNSINFPDIEKKYEKKLKPWKQKYSAFKNAQKDQEFHQFLEKYFSTWIRLKAQNDDISREEIESILRHEKPKLVKLVEFTPGEKPSYLTLLIYQKNGFRLYLHIKLLKTRSDIYHLRSVFSFWFEDYSSNWKANIRKINANYKNSVLAYEIFNKLKSLNYNQNSLRVKSQQNPKNIFSNTQNNNKKVRTPSNCLIKEVISVNPIKLLEQIERDLSYIEIDIRNVKNRDDLNPPNYFEALSKELQDFLMKGKELFLKTEDLLEKPRKLEKEIKKGEEKASTAKKLTFDQIVSFFKKEKELDDNSKSDENGFRTINEIYNKYKDLIKVSKPTFYDYFDKLGLADFLEVRDKKGKGGGEEYRYQELDNKRETHEEKIKQSLKKKKLEKSYELEIGIDKALSYYKNEDFKPALKNLKILVEKNDSQLKRNPRLLTITLYYIAKCYLNQKKFSEANEYFIKANLKSPDLIQPIYYTIETFFHLRKYNEGLEYAEKLIEKILNIIEENDLQEILDFIYLKGKYIEFEDEPPTRLLNKELIGEKNLLLKNKNPEKYIVDSFSRRHYNLTERQTEVLKKNYLSLQLLYRNLLSALCLKFEILRKLFFYDLLKEKNEKAINYYQKFEKQFDEFKGYEFLKRVFYIRDFGNYFHYFNKIPYIFRVSKLYNIVKEDFLNETNYVTFPRIVYLREKFEECFNFLNNLNSIIFKDFNQQIGLFPADKYSSSNEKIKSPQFKAEFLFMKSYINDYFFIDKRLKAEKQKFQSFDPKEIINEREEILNTPDEYYDLYLPSSNPHIFTETVRKAYDFIHDHNFDMLFDPIFNINQRTKRKVNEINKIRYKRRRKIIQRKLEILYDKYDPKSQKFTIKVEKENIINFRAFVEKNIMDKIKYKIKTHTGEISFEIELFNPDLNEEVIQYIKEKQLNRVPSKESYNPIFKLVPEFHIREKNKNIITTFHDTWDWQDPMTYGETKDLLNLKIYQAIALNLKDFRIIVSEDGKTEFRDYLQHTFPNEYENNFFNFELVENWDKNEITIKIKLKN